MSQKEFHRVKVIENAAGGRLSVREASRLLHLSERQVQRLPLLRRLQPTFGTSRRRRCLRLPPPAAPLRSGPLPQFALPACRGRRSHRHLGRAVDRVATLARPSRLRRRSGRTLPSTRRRVARLSRRSSPARPALAAGRTRPTPTQAPHLGAETKIANTYKLSGRPALAAVT